MIFFKQLSLHINETLCLEEIASASRKVWFAGIQQKNQITFKKPGADTKFFLSGLKNFPLIAKEINKFVPNYVFENSYITKCMPRYSMIPHKDKGRNNAIIIPLGTNKGTISYYMFNKKVFTHIYTGPILSRVNIDHSASNLSYTEPRYSITLELEGGFYKNYKQLS